MAARGGRPARCRPLPAAPRGQPPSAAGRKSRSSHRDRRPFYPERTVGSPWPPRCSPPWSALRRVLRPPGRRDVFRRSAAGLALGPTRTGRPWVRTRRSGAGAGPPRWRSPVRSGPAGPGAASGPVRPRPVRGEPLRSGPVRCGAFRTRAIRTGTIKTGGVRTGSVRAGAVRAGAARSRAVRSGSVRTRCWRSLRPGRAVLPRRRSVHRRRQVSVWPGSSPVRSWCRAGGPARTGPAWSWVRAGSAWAGRSGCVRTGTVRPWSSGRRSGPVRLRAAGSRAVRRRPTAAFPPAAQARNRSRPTRRPATRRSPSRRRRHRSVGTGRRHRHPAAG